MELCNRVSGVLLKGKCGWIDGMNEILVDRHELGICVYVRVRQKQMQCPEEKVKEIEPFRAPVDTPCSIYQERPSPPDKESNRSPRAQGPRTPDATERISPP